MFPEDVSTRCMKHRMNICLAHIVAPSSNAWMSPRASRASQ